MLGLIFVLIAVLLLTTAFIIKGAYERKMQIWLPAYINHALRRRRVRKDTIHILFCITDHFEPGHGRVEKSVWEKRVQAWEERYEAMACKFTDADGFHPRHTWFYPPHYFNEGLLRRLVNLCKKGYGEIEMHLHHNRMHPFPDNDKTLREKIMKCIEDYSRLGIFKTSINSNPIIGYGFIHGDWALDNSRLDPSFCGVDNELTILEETGCYADFTFPAYRIESQPKKVNTIYYAVDNIHRPKSYNTGINAAVGNMHNPGLMLIQGPLGILWKSPLNFPKVEYGEISSSNPPTRERIDFWIKKGIHVKGRDVWIVVKIHTHGAPESEHDVLLGEPAEMMHRYLQERYNDGKRYSIHYVTARELYNIIKAAEAGLNGHPGEYRDFMLDRYRYT